ncbi:aminotransferase class IV [Saccharibacillus sp. CPCC 101409]|uniref:aminotransferase class IV n=1 Tax=Saccharibacillus sp. CPCC 101409 TaxID=3058041 RepID=UPI002672B4A6|nr:aminotransferase class IV [Saccharibacillus sp. CPCC 101409]MDO3412883.1 aminotransferase class IV [Saccharibacillus sp. CPCC 101409]
MSGDRYLSLNGQIVEAATAALPVLDHGLLYGMGLFETFRTYGGSPFLLDRHLDRLARGARQLGIAYAADSAALRAEIAALLAANGLADAYIRLTLTAGAEGLGLPSGDSYSHPNRIVHMKTLPENPPSWTSEGRTLQVLNTRRNTPEGPVRLKSLHYMNGILARRELGAIPGAEGAEGLMLTREGFAAEGIVSNFFFAAGGRLYTPAVETGILPGITRAFVLELASRLGVETAEGFYTPDDLSGAEEMFLTGSVQEIVPVHRWRQPDGTTFVVGNGRPGPLTLRLMREYRHFTKETGN